MNINTPTGLGKLSLKSNLHPRFFTSLFFLSLIFLSGCISKGKIDIVLASSKNQTAALNVNVANIQVINNQIVLTGTNLNAVTEFKIKNGASITALEIESKSNTSLVANTLANVNFAVGAIFDFILSNANAASTFQVNFSLCDSLLGGKGFDCLIVPNDKDVLSFDAASNKWIPRNVNGLTYKGTFNASPGVDPIGSPLSGDYYLISTAGVINTVSYAIGDWIVYNADDSAWQKVSNSQDVLSVFGRTGKISAKEGDYNLTKMSDVDLTTVPPVLDQILKFNGTNWVPGTLVLPAAATGSAGAPSYSFSGNTNTGIFSPGTNQVAIASNGVERLRVDAAGNVGIGTNSPSGPFEINGGTATGVSSPGAPITILGQAASGVADQNGGNIILQGGARAGSASAGTINLNSDTYVSGMMSISDGSGEAGYTGTGANKTPTRALRVGNNSDSNATMIGLMSRNSTGVEQNAFIGVSPNNGIFSPSIVFGQQTGASAYQERMRIDSAGNVGIGTTTPRSALDVYGSVQVGTDGAACSATKAGAMRFATPNVEYCNGTAWTSISGGLSIPNGTQGGIPWYSATGAISSSSQLLLNGIVLGGGTTAPSTIGLGTANYVLTSNGVGGPPTWEAPPSGLPAAVGSEAAPAYAFTGFTTTGMFHTGTNILGFSTAGTEKMRIDASGNIGIGTTAPDAKLEVVGAAISRPNIMSTGNTVNLALSNVHILKSVGSSTIALSNMANGGSYTLVISDTSQRTYTFSGCTNTYYSPTNGQTFQRSTYSILTVIDTGVTDCYINWVTGFN